MADVEIIFLGSGCSATTPAVKCLTTSDTHCRTCTDAVTEGSPNRRRNTSVVVRLQDAEGVNRTILVDCGKDFYRGAVDIFARHGLTTIDAVLLTHGHADAIGGFDDLREWCQKGKTGEARSIQDALDVYCTAETLRVLECRFDFMFGARALKDRKTINIRILSETKPLRLFGHEIQPLLVQHGHHTDGDPYRSLGFMFAGQVAYLGDYNHIPTATMSLMRNAQPGAIILDVSAGLCADVSARAHAGVPAAHDVARELPSSRIYLTGINHEHTHSDWIAACAATTGHLALDHLAHADSTFVADAMRAVGKVQPTAFLRPAFDGFRFVVADEGVIEDPKYGGEAKRPGL